MQDRFSQFVGPIVALLLLPLLGSPPDRFPADDLLSRKKKLKRKGGSEETEKAVRAGLEWLERHQDEDGKWNSDGFGERCIDKEKKCGGPGFKYWDAGVTGLALLAFLGTGHTHMQGDFQYPVAMGIEWLKKNQKEEGDLDGAFGYVEVAEGKPKPEWVYNHAICTLAICEAYAASGDATLEEPAQRAVDLCVRARNPELAWRYGIRSDDNDTSVTGWMVQALRAAKVAGLEVPEDAFLGAREWLDRATSPGGATGYRSPDGSSSFLLMQQEKYDRVPCMTAVAMLTRIFTGQKKSAKVIRKGKSLLLKRTPAWPDDSIRLVNMYYWYYGTYGMFQMGGTGWGKWNKALKEALLPAQRKEVEVAGSWDPVGEWGIAGGRVYSTAISVLTLEVYYRYDRIK